MTLFLNGLTDFNGASFHLQRSQWVWVVPIKNGSDQKSPLHPILWQKQADWGEVVILNTSSSIISIGDSAHSDLFRSNLLFFENDFHLIHYILLNFLIFPWSFCDIFPILASDRFSNETWMAMGFYHFIIFYVTFYFISPIICLCISIFIISFALCPNLILYK